MPPRPKREIEKPLGKFIFAPSTFSPAQADAARAALTRTDVAQPAVGAASVGMSRLLAGLGVGPDFVAGHSYGEYVALWAAGALSDDDLYRLSFRRGRAILEATDRMPGGMAALDADADEVARLLDGVEGVTVANVNAPRQTVISGMGGRDSVTGGRVGNA